MSQDVSEPEPGEQTPDPDREDVPCGRLGEHAPHVWLTRQRLYCWGTGVRGSSAPPHPDDVDLGAGDRAGRRRNRRNRRG